MRDVHLCHRFRPACKKKQLSCCQYLIFVFSSSASPPPLCFSCLNQEPVWITGCPRRPQPPAPTCTRSMSEQTCLSRRSNQSHTMTNRSLRPLAAKLSLRWRWVETACSNTRKQIHRSVLCTLSPMIHPSMHFYIKINKAYVA